MHDANPRTAISWVNLLLDYGDWAAPAAPGEQDELPGNNGAYRRAALLQFGDRLDELLDVESVLQREMRRRGQRLYLEPAARVVHLNCSQPGAGLAVQWLAGRLYGARRAREEGWSRFRRLAYILAAPLILLKRLTQLLARLQRRGWRERPIRQLLPGLTWLLAAAAAGEAAGYLVGDGDARRRMLPFELYRRRYLVRRDREALARRVAGVPVSGVLGGQRAAHTERCTDNV